jgi:hypothetical protein
MIILPIPLSHWNTLPTGRTPAKARHSALTAVKLARLHSYNFEQLQRLVERQVKRIEADPISAIRNGSAGAIRPK